MDYKILEDFGAYVSMGEMISKPEGWRGKSAPIITYRSSADTTNEITFSGTSGYANYAIYRDGLGGTKKPFIGALVRQSGGARYMGFGLMSRIEYERSVGNTYNLGMVLASVTLEFNAGIPRLYHSAATADSGTGANKMLLATFPEIPTDTSVWLYLAADYSSEDPAQSKIYVGIDGNLHEVTFNRNRIQSGYQAQDFDAVCIMPTGGAGSWNARVSSVIAGDLEEDAPDPVRGIVRERSTGSDLAGSPANDASRIEISNTDWIDRDLIPGTIPTRIVAAQAQVRLGAAGGEEDAFGEVVYEWDDGGGINPIQVVRRTIAVSDVGTIYTKNPPYIGTLTDPARFLSGKFRFRSVS